MDLRYLNNGRYSFVAIAHLTHDNEIDHSYIGWVFSEDKLQRKLFFTITYKETKAPLSPINDKGCLGLYLTIYQ